MGKATEVLEHAGHAGHAGGHGGSGDRFPILVGITMALLGVLLAFASAKVGGERTELVKTLVEQQNAHAKYQAQDIKHRTAVISLRQLHANLPDLPKATATAQRAPGVTDKNIPRAEDMIAIAKTVNRYYGESKAAKEWVEAYDPITVAHLEGQERYERAQLIAEFGIILASIALLLRLRTAWFVAVILGISSLVYMGTTYRHLSHEVAEAEEKVEHLGKAYRDLRNAGKMTAMDQALVDEVLSRYGVMETGAANAQSHSEAKQEHAPASH